jgi:hypothetical protein
MLLFRSSPSCTGSIRSKQGKLWLTLARWFQRVRNWALVCVLKRSNACLVFTRVLIWSVSSSYDERDFQNFQIEYNRQDLIRVIFSNGHNLSHRWPIESYLHKQRPWCPLQVHKSAAFLKMRSKPSQHLFSIIDLAKWAPRITKFWICKINT